MIRILEETSDCDSMVLLENTAGQGKSIGSKFEHLRAIMDIVQSDRVGVCFDTCHAFAAGFDIKSEDGYKETFDLFNEIVGLEHLKCLHLNDSKGALGSNLDRHENIGFGEIGNECFARIMNDFKHIPKILETPKGETPKGTAHDTLNLRRLKRLMA